LEDGCGLITALLAPSKSSSSSSSDVGDFFNLFCNSITQDYFLGLQQASFYSAQSISFLLKVMD